MKTSQAATRFGPLLLVFFAALGFYGCEPSEGAEGATLEVELAFAEGEDAAFGQLPPAVVRAEIKVIAPMSGEVLAQTRVDKDGTKQGRAILSELPPEAAFILIELYDSEGTRLGYYAESVLLIAGGTTTIVVNLLLIGPTEITPRPPEPRPRASRLAFAVHPKDHVLGESIEVVVVALDENGQLARGASATVTLSGEGVQAIDPMPLREGAARFSELIHSSSGAGFRMSATANGLERAESLLYNVLAPPDEPDIPTAPAVLTSIEIVPPLGLTAPGSFRQYRALGRYDDGSTKDLTDEVSWASDNDEVAIAAGDAGELEIGRAEVSSEASLGTKATITASFEGYEAEATLRINLFVYAGMYQRVQPLKLGAEGALELNGPHVTDLVVNPGGLLIHPNGVWAYILNTSGETGAYLIEEDGTLTPNGSVPAGSGTISGAFAGDYLYAHAANSGTIAIYRIHDDGSLSVHAQPVSAGGINGFSMAAHPSGRYVYAATKSSITPFIVEDDGLLSANGSPIPFESRSYIATDPKGHYLFAAFETSNELAFFKIEEDGTLSSNGPSIPITDGATPGDPRGVTMDPHGSVLYIANYNHNPSDPHGPPYNFRGVLSYTIEPDGRATPLSSALSRQALRAVALDPVGRYIWGFGLFSAIDLFSIASDGSLNHVPQADMELDDNQARFLRTTP